MKATAWLALSLALAALPSTASGQSADDALGRGQVEYAEGDFSTATIDFSIFCHLAPKDTNADYAHVFIWLAQARLDQKARADTELSHVRATSWNAKPDAWISKIAAFFLDQISETDLFEAANRPGVETVNQQHCEAWYYAGIKRLIAGDETTALEYFNNCLDTGEETFTEYYFAQSQLKALGQSIGIGRSSTR